MEERQQNTVRWSGAGGGRSTWVFADLDKATLTWKPNGKSVLGVEEVARLRALAEVVLPEHANLQPMDITYACEEHLDIHLAGRRCALDIMDGEIAYGPPHDLVVYMRSLCRPHASGVRPGPPRR